MDSPAYRGWWGEYRVNLMLRLCLSNDYKILANSIYRGQRKGESTQVDHIVVSRYGIFVIETKTLKGVIKVDSEQPSKWVQIVLSSSKLVKTNQNGSKLVRTDQNMSKWV